MKILIAGVGQIGSLIVKYLSSENHDVLVVDLNTDIVKSIVDNYSVAGVAGNILSLDTLNEIEIATIDIFVAATSSDETNLLACYLSNLFGVQNKIARLSSKHYLEEQWKELFLLQKMPVNEIIAPERQILPSIKEIITHSYLDLFDIFYLADSPLRIFSFICQEDSISANQTVSSIEQESKNNNIYYKVAGILRDQQFIIPTSDFIIKVQDRVLISCAIDDIATVYWMVNMRLENANEHIADSQQNNIVITGDHPFISTLATNLKEHYDSISVVLKEEKNNTDDPLVLELESSDISLIKTDILANDYRYSYVKSLDDIIIIICNSDEESTLTAMILKDQGFSRIFCWLQDNTYEGFMTRNKINTFNINHFIMNPVLCRLRKGLINNIFSFYDQAEIVDLEIVEKSKALGKSVAEIEKAGQIKIIGIINRQHETMNFFNDTVINLHDKVTYVCMRKSIEVAEQFFASSYEINAI